MHHLKVTDEVAGRENDGPSKSQIVKMQDLKLQDYVVFSVTAKFLMVKPQAYCLNNSI